MECSVPMVRPSKLDRPASGLGAANEVWMIDRPHKMTLGCFYGVTEANSAEVNRRSELLQISKDFMFSEMMN